MEYAWRSPASMVMCDNSRKIFCGKGTMKNKIAPEEHFSIEGMEKYTSDVVNAPTFAEVTRRG
jgi:hypothetical protein